MRSPAKKQLGQNFLIDKGVLKRIASLLAIRPDDEVIEVGPGHGELTEEIIALSPKKLSVIEKDADLWPVITEKFAENKGFSLIKGDALELLAKTAPKKGGWKIVGNIPYYITGHLFRVIGELDNPPSLSVFTVQKEVAERASATPPKMNLLSASLGFWADVHMADIVKKGSFRPIPKVDSAVVVITRKKDIPKNAERYYKTMRALFKQPRKTVLNNLSEGLSMSKEEAEKIFSLSGIDPSLRPQDLSVANIIELSDRTPR